MSDFARLRGGRAALASDRVDLSVLLSEAAASVEPVPGAVAIALAVLPPQTSATVAADRARLARAIAAVAAMIARADDIETVVAAG